MASIYRRTRSYPIPSGAEIIERRRKARSDELQADPTRATVVERFAKWTDRKGQARKAPLNAAGDRVLIEPGNYLIAYWDAGGKRMELNSGTPDRDAAEQIAGKLDTEVALRKRGIIDPTQERIAAEGRRSLQEHVADFRAMMEAAGRTAGHITKTVGFISSVTTAAGIKTVSDLTADAVNTYAADLQAQGKSARTVQAVLTAAKTFTRWLTLHGKLAADPLASVAKPSPKTDRRHERRMLLPEEWEWLRTTTEAGPHRYNMPGRERMLVYAVAIQTGLRFGELASLTRGRLFLGSSPPYVTCKAGNTKNRQDARQYLQHDLAELLQAHIATKAPGVAVFTMPCVTNAARMFRADLQDARRAWLDAAGGSEERLRREQSDFLADRNHEGEVADFHSLRHTCGAWLAMADNHPKTVQAIMRHSTITLTMDTYGHLFPGQEADAVAKMPGMFGSGPEALQATGTDFSLPANRQQQTGEIIQYGAHASERADGGSTDDAGPKVLSLCSLGEERQHLAKGCESRPGGSRTPDQGIMSPLL